MSWILRRDWNRGLGQKLDGKIHLYVGDMDNYYLNNAVYLVEDFLKSTKDPHYGGEVTYGDRAEHCWNGDPTRANAYSRLRYHQMFIPRVCRTRAEDRAGRGGREVVAVLNSKKYRRKRPAHAYTREAPSITRAASPPSPAARHAS